MFFLVPFSTAVLNGTRKSCQQLMTNPSTDIDGLNI